MITLFTSIIGLIKYNELKNQSPLLKLLVNSKITYRFIYVIRYNMILQWNNFPNSC